MQKNFHSCTMKNVLPVLFKFIDNLVTFFPELGFTGSAPFNATTQLAHGAGCKRRKENVV